MVITLSPLTIATCCLRTELAQARTRGSRKESDPHISGQAADPDARRHRFVPSTLLTDLLTATGLLLQASSKAQLDALTPFNDLGLACIVHLDDLLERQGVARGRSAARS